MTKLMGQVKTILQEAPGELNAKTRDQLQRIDLLLSEKLTLLSKLHDQIIAKCMVEEIEREIDETETFKMYITDTRVEILMKTTAPAWNVNPGEITTPPEQLMRMKSP